MGRLVEEILRLEPPVRAMSRMTTRAVELGGTPLPEGAHLLLLFASGNDDERVFEHAREFDIDRRNLVRSMSFGAGAHLCLGISLARMQLRVAAKRAARRLKNLRLAVPAETIRIIPNVALLARESLPLRFSPEG
jgi:cytochrome P450